MNAESASVIARIKYIERVERIGLRPCTEELVVFDLANQSFSAIMPRDVFELGEYVTITFTELEPEDDDVQCDSGDEEDQEPAAAPDGG
jgi:hypothetical protein